MPIQWFRTRGEIPAHARVRARSPGDCAERRQGGVRVAEARGGDGIGGVIEGLGRLYWFAPVGPSAAGGGGSPPSGQFR